MVSNTHTQMPPRASCESVDECESATSTLRSPIEPASNDNHGAPPMPPTSSVKVENIPATANPNQRVPHTANPNQRVPHTARPTHEQREPPTAIPYHANHLHASTYDTGIIALKRLLLLRQTMDPRVTKPWDDLIRKQIRILQHLLLTDPRESALSRYIERLADCRILIQNQWKSMDHTNGLGDNFVACEEIEDVINSISFCLRFQINSSILKDMDPLTAVESLMRTKDKLCHCQNLEWIMKSLIDNKYQEIVFLQQRQLSAIEDDYRIRFDATYHQQPMRYAFTHSAVNDAGMRFPCTGPNCRACQHSLHTSSSILIPWTPLGKHPRCPPNPHPSFAARHIGYSNPDSAPQNPPTFPYIPQSSQHSNSSDTNLSQEPTLTEQSTPSPSPEPRLAPSFSGSGCKTPPLEPPSGFNSNGELLTEAARKARHETRRANQRKRRHPTTSEIDSQSREGYVQ